MIFYIKRKNNIGLTGLQKLIGQLLIAIIFFIIFMKGGREPSLIIYTLNITIPMGWVYGAFILFMLVASSNAVNLTDGLDGLAGGLSAIAFLAFRLNKLGFFRNSWECRYWNILFYFSRFLVCFSIL